jgi:hypothetical protein
MNAILLCEVQTPGNTSVTTFEVSDTGNRFISGPGYIDGISKHMPEALSLARWQKEQTGYYLRVSAGGYQFTFSEKA